MISIDNYDFKGKYMLSATMRGDGSSKFSKGQKWGYFPSVAASWRLSDEWGMKDLRWLDNLKLRYSFGTAGNNNIPTGMGGLTQLLVGKVGNRPAPGNPRRLGQHPAKAVVEDSREQL